MSDNGIRSGHGIVSSNSPRSMKKQAACTIITTVQAGLGYRRNGLRWPGVGSTPTVSLTNTAK